MATWKTTIINGRKMKYVYKPWKPIGNNSEHIHFSNRSLFFTTRLTSSCYSLAMSYKHERETLRIRQHHLRACLPPPPSGNCFGITSGRVSYVSLPKTKELTWPNFHIWSRFLHFNSMDSLPFTRFFLQQRRELKGEKRKEKKRKKRWNHCPRKEWKMLLIC